MSSRSVRLYLNDVAQACQDILAFTTGMQSGDDLQNDRRTMLAVIRCLEIIGEAARQIPLHYQEQNPSIPWWELISFRNVMAHEYFGVDYDIVWDVIQTEIPPLLEKIILILSQMPEGENWNASVYALLDRDLENHRTWYSWWGLFSVQLRYTPCSKIKYIYSAYGWWEGE